MSDLDQRSALGCYSFALHFPEHEHTGRQACSICRTHHKDIEELDLNVLSFERHKWGGVRHTSPEYAGFDLEQFQKMDKLTPCADDFLLMNQILSSILDLPDWAGPNEAERAIQKATDLKSNKSERQILIQILGYCGVLETPDHPSFATRYTPYQDICNLPNEWAYPVIWWRRPMGINWDAVRRFFPHEEIQIGL